jgi:type IV pilus assembly protein PilW
MKLSPTAQTHTRAEAGFSLVEIMVGLLISMLAIIVVLQVFSVFESRKRTLGNGGDAQTNGALAFQQIQRDISQAGYGFSAGSVFYCNVSWTVASGSLITTPVRLAPVTINPGTAIIPAGDANTDTMLVMYGNTNGQPQGNPISARTSAVYTVQMPTAFAIRDKVIAAPAACGSTTLLIDEITAVAANTVTLATGSAGTVLYNLGPAPVILAYAIRGGNLTVCDYLQNDCGIAADKDKAAIWAPVASNIVSMKAVYWRDTTVPDMDGFPDADGHDRTAPENNCDWVRISAIGMALVARSGEYDKGIVTATSRNAPATLNAPSWTENATAPLIGATGTLGPDQTADEPWKHYRYKVLEAVVPIRNVAWMGAVQGC